LIICEICGAANLEFHEQCRICGHQFATSEAKPAAVPAHFTAEQVNGATAQSGSWAQSPQPERLSSMGQPPATSTPPLLGNPAHHPDDLFGAAAEPELPTFMQPAPRPLSAPEPVQLISASDLPDWIRQIAEDDRVKAEAEAAQRAAHVETAPEADAPSFATDSKAAGPSTNWLSKTAAVASDTVDPWSITQPTPADARAEAPSQPHFAAYPIVTPTPIYMPEPSEKPARQMRMPRFTKAHKVASTEARRPIYRSTLVQIALLLLLVVVLAALLV
jgi:hypothetical protein